MIAADAPRASLPVAVLIAALLVGCRRRTRPCRLLVIGIDGAEWRVIRRLCGRPENCRTCRRLADRGTTATLQTAYNASPVIWTTIATGVTPHEHGITDFVVPGPQRRRADLFGGAKGARALEHAQSRVHRRVAVVGWWGSWPAEDVDGVVVSDRALLDIESRVSPSAYLPRLKLAIDRRARRRSSSPSRRRSSATRPWLPPPRTSARRTVRSHAAVLPQRRYREPPRMAGGWRSRPGVSGRTRAWRGSIARSIRRSAGAAPPCSGPQRAGDLGPRIPRRTRDDEIRTQSDLDAAAYVHLGYQVRTPAASISRARRLYCVRQPATTCARSSSASAPWP